MIDIAFLDDMLGRMLAAGLSELEIEDGGSRLVLRLGSAPGSAPPVSSIEVKAEAIGRFRAAHPRRPDMAVRPGDRTAGGAVLGYLELGATLTSIIAPADGVVTAIAPAEGQLVSYGEKLFTIKGEA
jgi:biotin carboxyl carrier protein